VEISKLDCPRTFAIDLMSGFEKAFCNAGRPVDAQVFRGEDQDNIIFHFSPAASALAPKDLRHYRSVACAEPPDLTAFKKVPFRAT
jgi:hypothetical protein